MVRPDHVWFAIIGPCVQNVVQPRVSSMEFDSTTTEGELEPVDLVQDVYVYLTERCYPPSCTETRKRSIRRKEKSVLFAKENCSLLRKIRKIEG